MEVLIYILLVIAAMWVIQLYFAAKQSMRFSASLREVRAKGRTAVGIGGFRYRGGRAFVALSEKNGVVVAAKVLVGWTVFASAIDYPQLVGKQVTALANGEQMETLRKKVQDAAKMAAEVLLKDEKLGESDTAHTP
jgi:DNA-binding transcriptional regulator of glucitol operon